MAQVTITGRVLTVLLARGQTTTVEDTERIRSLAASGYVYVHEQSPPAAPQTDAQPESEHAPDDDEARAHSGDETPSVAEPPRSGPGSHRDEWVQHLIEHGVEHEQDATKSDLISTWDAHIIEQDAQ